MVNLRIRIAVFFLLLGLLYAIAIHISPVYQKVEGARRQERSTRSNRPNILLVLADDLDQKLGTMQYTPNIQVLLHDQGLTFDDFLVTNALCGPSRATILRGQYTKSHKVYTNRSRYGGFGRMYELGIEKSTIATWLQNSGYRTGYFGKYLNGYPDEDRFKAPKTYVPDGWSEWYSPVEGAGYVSFGYDMNENGKLTHYGSNPADYITDVIARKAEAFIHRAKKNQKPFFMHVATYAPHRPATPAPRHSSLFLDVMTPVTPSFNEADVSDKPADIQRLALFSGAQIESQNNAYRIRLQSMQAVDEMVARLVHALTESGQLGNTYIFFSSDNGYHIGQHRLPSGKDTAYEEDIRVPMIVRGPGVPAGTTVRDYLVANIDLASTFAELAGVTVPDFVEGRSLVPFLKSNPPSRQSWRKAFLLEHYGNTTRDPVPIYLGLRTTRLKYVEYRTGERELYDLLVDPDELNNQIETADPTMVTKLSVWLNRLHSCAGENCRRIETTAAQPP